MWQLERDPNWLLWKIQTLVHLTQETTTQQKSRNIAFRLSPTFSGAGEEIRTLDPNLGKVVLYQLSYSRTPLSSFQSPVLGS